MENLNESSSKFDCIPSRNALTSSSDNNPPLSVQIILEEDKDRNTPSVTRDRKKTLQNPFTLPKNTHLCPHTFFGRVVMWTADFCCSQQSGLPCMSSGLLLWKRLNKQAGVQDEDGPPQLKHLWSRWGFLSPETRLLGALSDLVWRSQRAVNVTISLLECGWYLDRRGDWRVSNHRKLTEFPCKKQQSFFSFFVVPGSYKVSSKGVFTPAYRFGLHVKMWFLLLKHTFFMPSTCKIFYPHNEKEFTYTHAGADCWFQLFSAEIQSAKIC